MNMEASCDATATEPQITAEEHCTCSQYVEQMEDAISKIEGFFELHKPNNITLEDLNSRFVLLGIILSLSDEDRGKLVDLLLNFYSVHNQIHSAISSGLRQFFTMIQECKDSLTHEDSEGSIAIQLRFLPSLVGYVLDLRKQHDLLLSETPIFKPRGHHMYTFDNGIKVLA